MRAVLALAAVALIAGLVASAWTAYLAGVPFLLLPVAGMALGAFWLVWVLSRSSPSDVRINDEQVEVRFFGLVTVAFSRHDVLSTRVVQHHIWVGLGARVTIRGVVVLSAVTGPVTEVTLRAPLRVWLIPRILPVRTTRIRLGVENPDVMAEALADAG